MAALATRRARRVGWLVMAAVAVVALSIGAFAGGGGPRTSAERVDAIAKTIKCPSCRSESVFESRAASAENLRAEIARHVAEGKLSDDQIRRVVVAPFGNDLLLTPPSSGVAGLVWVLPVAAFVCAVAGLVVAFRRWRTRPSAELTEADRALVRAALESES